jgi:hypothetical protein
MAKSYPYKWVQKKRLGGRVGQRCRILGKRDGAAIVVEFEDGERVVANPSAVRRVMEGKCRKQA